MKPRKILAIASGGGHWVQLRRINEAFEGLDVVFASVRSEYAEDVPGHRFYAVRDVTRWDRVGFVVLAVQLLMIFLREKPTVVLTTGSAPGLVALMLAKCLFRARTMWIDSVANYAQMSVSGMRAKRFADVWLTQWPHLCRKDGVACWGAVL